MLGPRVRGRLNAWGLAALDGYMHWKFGPLKRERFRDLPTDSVEYVFCSLVLCSVRDPARVIAQVRRVLKPGGRFVCIEHVQAPAGTFARRLQHRVRRPWRWAFDGCDVCRDTGMLLRSAGFSRVDVQPMAMRTFALPIKHQITAVCVK